LHLVDGYELCFIVTALTSGVLGAFLGQFIPHVFGLFRGDIKNQVVTEINQTLIPITRDIGELKTQIAVLKNSIENLEKFGAVGRFKTQATKLGIKNPQIASVDLKPQATFTALFTLRDQPGSFVQMDYDIEEVSKDAITVAVRGTIFDRGRLWDKFGPLRHKIPATAKTFTFHFTGKTKDGRDIPFPAIRLAILDRDEKNNNLIVATGEAAQPTT